MHRSDPISGYYRINREERNHVAILYHLLLSGKENLDRFLGLKVIALSDPNSDRAEVYYEFAFLRDAWKGMSDEARRVWLLAKLKAPDLDPLRTCSVEAFNQVFAPRSGASKERIQSPANWMPALMSDQVADRMESIHLLKWCFNLKPDLVIITSDGTVVSVEAKLESGEDKYTVHLPNGALFSKSQRQCQEAMFIDLLGVPKGKYKPVLLVRNKSDRRAGEQITWSEAFKHMNVSGSHPFVRQWLEENTVYKSKSAR